MFPFEFHPFLGKSELVYLSLMKVYSDQNGEIGADLEIINRVVFPKKDPVDKQLMSFERQRLIINQDALSQLKLLHKVRKILMSSHFSKALGPISSGLSLVRKVCILH